MESLSLHQSLSQHSDTFRRRFSLLCGFPPYPWQERLFFDLLSKPDIWGRNITAPTGSGKTSLMAIWLLALLTEHELGQGIRLPRRLAWVVNRRVVVDQATDDALQLSRQCEELGEFRRPLAELGALQSTESPLAISTLRGERADNREWSRNPARPAIIIGTVDMIGSRLLFSGYGNGKASKPQHAALLGQDCLIVNDESHLTPAFAHLLDQVAAAQEAKPGLKPFRVLKLSATSGAGSRYPDSFDADLQTPEFRRRFTANKSLHFHPTEDRKSVFKRCREIALAPGSNRTIIFFRSPIEVRDFSADLEKNGVPAQQISLLTGTQRGYERDQLCASPAFRVFLEKEEPALPHFLIATSAGEVGINATCSRLVSTLDTADHLLQRFGRLNRFGENAQSAAYIVYVPPKEKEPALIEALDFLHTLPDLSPQTLFATTYRPTAPAPITAPLQEWLLDRWALTSVKAGRPPVADYLHGKQEYDPPRTILVWREEIALLTRPEIDPEDREKALTLHRPLAHEKVDTPTTEAILYLRALPVGQQADHEKQSLIVQSPQGEIATYFLDTLLALRDDQLLNLLRESTIWLPPSLCYLRNGMLDSTNSEASPLPDVADHPLPSSITVPSRARFLLSAHDEADTFALRQLGDPSAPTSAVHPQSWREDLLRDGWRIVHEIALPLPEQPDQAALLIYAQRVKAQQTPVRVPLQAHLEQVSRQAQRFVTALHLESHGEAIIQAAERHDVGKSAAIFQTAVGGIPSDPAQHLAKSGRTGKLSLGGFRHELAALLGDTPPEELVAHLIATHHGYGRPHFPPGSEDPARVEACQTWLASQPLRFSLLQERFGHWGLAYLESILRAADWLASEEEQSEHV